MLAFGAFILFAADVARRPSPSRKCSTAGMIAVNADFRYRLMSDTFVIGQRNLPGRQHQGHGRVRPLTFALGMFAVSAFVNVSGGNADPCCPSAWPRFVAALLLPA